MALTDRPEVHPIREARASLPAVARSFGERGIAAGVYYLGAHRKPEAVLVPVDLFDALKSQAEDLIIAARVSERDAMGDERRYTLEQLTDRLGFDPHDVEVAAKQMLAERE